MQEIVQHDFRWIQKDKLQTASLLCGHISRYHCYCFHVCPAHVVFALNINFSWKGKSFYNLYLLKDGTQDKKICPTWKGHHVKCAFIKYMSM